MLEPRHYGPTGGNWHSRENVRHQIEICQTLFYRFENKREGQRNNTGHQFDEVSSLIEIAITYMDRRPCCRTGTQGTRSTRTRARGMGALVMNTRLSQELLKVCE